MVGAVLAIHMRNILLIASLSTFVLGVGVPSASSDLSDRAAWLWSANVPGNRVVASDEVLAALEMSPDIDPTTVRETITAGSGKRSVTLLAARNHSGQLCVGAVSSLTTGALSCLNGAVESESVITFQASGGTEIGNTRWATIVGIVRSDVERILISLNDGSQRKLPLTGWRAFAYAADSWNELPVALTSLDSDGAVIHHVGLRFRLV